MSFTSTVTQSNPWKRVKMQYVAPVAAAALAASAVLAIGLQTSPKAAISPASPASPMAAMVTGEAPRAIFYIFSSQTDAAIFESVISQHTAAVAETNVQRYVRVAATDKEYRETLGLIGEAAREVMQHGSGRLDLVDMRPTS